MADPTDAGWAEEPAVPAGWTEEPAIPTGWTEEPVVSPTSTTPALEDVPGNIDLTNRPRVQNDDGSISTVRSMSFQDVDGHEVLVPTVSPDGRVLSDEEAIALYRATGQHLGKFTTPEAATDFAQRIHESEAQKLKTPTGWPYLYAPEGDQLGSVPAGAEFLSPAGSYTWQTPGEPSDFVTTEAYKEKRAAENEAIRSALIAAAAKGQGDKATAYQVAQALGLHVSDVQQNLEAFRAAAVATKADPEAFRKQAPPELVRLVLRNPTLASNLVETKQGGELSNLLRGMAKAVWEGITHLGSGYAGAGDISLESSSDLHQAAAAEEILRKEQAYQQIASGWVTEDVPLTEALTSKEDAQAWLDKHEEDRVRARTVLQKFEASRQEKTVKQVDDAQAQASREGGATGLVTQRYGESTAGLEASRLRYFRMMASLGGAPADELLDYDTRIHDLELDAQPRYLGEGELGQLTGESTQGVASTVGMLPQMGERAVAGMTVGALGSAILAKGAGLPMLPAARAGALAMAGPSAALGAGEASFYVEAGSTQKDLSEVLTDKGERLSEAEVAGGALVAGALKAALEVMELNALAKTFGVSRGLLPANPRKEVADLLTKDPRFRAIVARAATQWLKSSAEEGLEEGFQTATDNAVAYLVKSVKDRALQKGPVLDQEDIGQSMVAGAAGGFAMGSVGTTTQVISNTLQARSAARVETQVKQVLQLAQHEASKEAPAEVAQAAMEASAKAGLPVTSLHVEGKAAQRFFQERAASPEEAQAQADEAFGPGGAQRVAEAAATGGFVEVPMADVLGRWGQTEASKALASDTTTHPSLMTPRQLAEGGLERINAEAQRIVEEAVKGQAEAQQTQDQLDAFEAQVRDTYVEKLQQAGESEKDAKQKATEAARLAKGVVRAFMETQAANFQTAVGQLFPEVPVMVQAGDEAAANQPGRADQAAFDTLRQRAATVDTTTRASELFIDPVSGLRTRRAWDASPRQAGKQVAVITSPDVKALNDAPTGGHDTANELLRLIGGVVGSLDAEAARSGTNFLLHVANQAQLNSALETIREALPQGLTVEGAVGATLDEAFPRLDKATEAKRTAGKLLPRGQTNFAVDTLGPETFAAGRAASPNISEQLRAAAEAMTPEAFGKEAYFDAVMPDTLTKTGFDAAPAARFVASIDVKGLKLANEVLGKKAGDRLLKLVGRTAARMGGKGLAFAHLSGDEFAAKHDNRAELDSFLKDLDAALAEVGVPATILGRRVTVRPLFRAGIGEKSYGAADQVLNRAKRREQRGSAGNLAGRPGRTDAERLLDQVRGDRRPAVSGRRDSAARLARADRRRAGEAAAGNRSNEGRGGSRLGQLSQAGRLFAENDSTPAPKGYIEAQQAATSRVVAVFLNQQADVSTVLHETAHAFLYLLEQLAARPDAPERTKQTYADAMKWLGGTDIASLKREQHERWARSFEAYLLEGKTPSAALAKVFALAKRWLERIYRAVANIPEQQLNDDVRRVFDSMLATQREVDNMMRRHGPDTFASAQEAGISEAQWQAQLEAQREAYNEASRKVQLQAVKDALRVHEKWWKDGLEKLRTRFADEYEQLPGRRAQRLLEEGDIALDRASVEAVIGTARVKGLRTVEEGGVRPADVAEAAGIQSPAVMLAALAGLKPKERWVEEQARAEMERLHPGILDDVKRMRAEVANALQDVAEQRILDEMSALHRVHPELGGAPVEAIRRAARQLVEQREMRHVSPARALQQERSAAERAARAAAAGNWTEVATAKREQLLNAFVYRELQQAEKDVDRLEKLAQRLAKATARARLGKAMPSYRDAVEAILDAFLRGQPADLDVLRQAIADMNANAVIVGDPEWYAELLKAEGTPWERLTVTQVRFVLDALRNLQAAAAQRNTVLLDEKRVDRDTLVAQLVAEAAQYKKPRPLPATRSAQTRREKVGDFLSGWDAFLRNPIDLIRELVGDNHESAWWKAFVNVMRRGKYREAELLKQTVEPIVKAFEAIPKKVRASLNDAIDGAKMFPTHANFAAPRRRFELLMMALNAGNTSNLQRLLDGRNITLEQVRTALDTLTKEEIDWVQSIFDASESLKPEAFGIEERLTGLRPKAIEATPLELQNGTLRGGYFPAVYESRASQVGQQQEATALAQLFDPTYKRPGTPHSHLKERADRVEAVISLEPGTIYAHLAQVVHDIAFREALMSIGGLLMDRRVDAVLKERLGYEKTKSFLQWAQDVGSAQSPASNAVVRAVKFVRSRMAPALLGWRIPTALGDLANLPAAVPSTKLTTASLMRGIVGFLKSPLSARREALAKSPELRFMAHTARQQFQSVADTFFAKGSAAMRWYKEHAFDFMEAIGAVTSTPIWMGAYSQALRSGLSEEAAVRWADDVLTQVFPSHSAVEQAGIIRDKGFAGLSTVFYGYLSVAYRAQARIVSDVTSLDFTESSPKGKAKTIASVTGRMLAFWLAYQLLGELLMGRGPEGGDKDDEEPENEALQWGHWMLRKLLSAPLQSIPFIGDTVPVIEAALLGRQPRAREGVLSSYLTSIGAGALKALDGEKDPFARADAAWRVMSTALGLPAYPVSTPMKYWLQVGKGDIEPAGVGDAAIGSVYGPPKN